MLREERHQNSYESSSSVVLHPHKLISKSQHRDLVPSVKTIGSHTDLAESQSGVLAVKRHDDL